MKKEKLVNMVLRVVERTAWNEVEKNVLGGKPACAGIYLSRRDRNERRIKE